MATTKCPICSRHVRSMNLTLHVEDCLSKHEVATKSSPFLPPSAEPRNSTASKAVGFSPPPSSPSPSAVKKRKWSQLHDVSATPLAERMRPIAINDVVGQEELLGPGKLLSSLIQVDRVPNMILWGPPGCGKTTLAHVISKRTSCKFISLSGATSKVADMKDAVDRARSEQTLLRRRTIVFVDEIHHLNKGQQDFFLPAVEDGTITLIGATTENPSFEVNNALLSRCRVYILKKHTAESIEKILQRALRDHSAGGVQSLTRAQESETLTNADSVCDKKFERALIDVEDGVIKYIATLCAGDARVALNCLEMALQTAPIDPENHVLRVSCTHVQHCFSHRQPFSYDRNADMHYDCISALHKSIRGSDENATLYWLARMLEGGENPLYVARRLIRIASEDVGLAAPELLPLAVSSYQAAHFIGMPECDVILAHVATMLARAPKSVEVYAAYKRTKRSIREWKKGALPDVPLHLRNAPTKLMKSLGYGKEYKYNPHYSAEEVKNQTYLPEELLGTNFFEETATD
ncbi:atpase wrnip1 [Plasmopara halstedii]|uniref:Atpase wrnip1 n=1 Tax=Plasmopara halstedii TaxID=4781 RepID=A0A0P1ACV9_PLAHL|nr:atpase wrnip1 [Plasmopara halstedii]CEG38406.1 atpase wrnip1 [Plasmopara halstedii]|eukprot:XP_024574775.1 atpase wrnip1 [Plasmopara halstedii]